ncbi:MAG: GAF domain-containing protein, partial [Anaerolineae bacterium]
MTAPRSLPSTPEGSRALQDTFQVVRRLVLDLLAASQESQVLEVTAEQVRLLLGASASCVLLRAPGPAPGPLDLVAWDGLPEALRQECQRLKGQPGAQDLSQGARTLWETARRAMLQGGVVQGREAPPGFATLVVTPLKRRKEAIGVLALLFREPRSLDRTDIYILESSAALATAVLDNVSLLRQERERRLQAALLLEVTQAATSSLALEEVLQQVAEKTARLAQADRCSIWLLNDAGDTLLPAALSGMDRAFVQEWLKHPLHLDQEPLSRQALESGQPVVVHDALTDPRTDKDAVRLFSDRSIVVFPLLGRQRRLGTLFLNWVREQKVLSEAELELAQAVAAQATVAIEYAWMHAQTEARLQETRAAYRQLRALQETTALLATT